MSDNRSIVYLDEEQNKIVYRASGLGTCTRALVACRIGYEPKATDSVSAEFMGEGVLHEDHVLKRLEATGAWEIAGRGQEEVELVVRESAYSGIPSIVIRGHIDEVARAKDANFDDVFYVVEVKTMSETVYRTFLAHGIEAFPHYAMQLSIYMTALGMPGLFVTKNRNTGAQMETKFGYPPYDVSAIVERILSIEDAAKAEELPECDDRESFYCKFDYLHESKKAAREFPVPDEEFVSSPEFEELVKQYHQQRLQEDAARWKRDELRVEILSRMGEHREIHIPGYDISRKEVIQRRLDNAKVKKLLPKDQRDSVTIEQPVEYFLVDPRKT